MIVSAARPYFAPFGGHFAKILLSDVFVILDSVQFPRGATWLTRNRLKNDQGIMWVRVPVWKKGLGLQKINEVRICHEKNWASKNLDSLQTAYKNAPYFQEQAHFFKALFSNRPDRLVDLNLKIFRHVMDLLNHPVRLVFLSDLDITAKEPMLSLEICKKLGATRFLIQKSAEKVLPREVFEKEGIHLMPFSWRQPVYPQLWGTFIPNLSILDLLFSCGPKSISLLKNGIIFRES